MATTGAKKKLILNAFVMMCKLQTASSFICVYTRSSTVISLEISNSRTGSGHQSPGLWRHPDDESHRFDDTEHWVELAKLLEEAKFHGIFIADVLGGYDVYRKSLEPAIVSGAQWPVTEPLAVVPAMAAATKNIGFGVTVSTTYEQPYHLARRLSTVDHLTKGR